MKMNKKGLTLVEVIVASVLLALISAGIFSITLSSRRLINRSSKRHYANKVAEAALENLRQYLGADEWYNNSSPINPAATSIFNNSTWSSWYYLNSNNFLNMQTTFGSSEFAIKYNGRWRYKVSNAASPYEYRKAEVEVGWTELTP